MVCRWVVDSTKCAKEKYTEGSHRFSYFYLFTLKRFIFFFLADYRFLPSNFPSSQLSASLLFFFLFCYFFLSNGIEYGWVYTSRRKRMCLQITLLSESGLGSFSNVWGEKIIPVKKKSGEEIRKYAMLPHTFAQGFIIQMTSNVCTGSISAGESVKRVRAEHKRKKSTITFFLQGLQRQQKASRSYRVSETNGNWSNCCLAPADSFENRLRPTITEQTRKSCGLS